MDERILLVEDDPSIREVVGAGLRHAGFRVDEVANGADGLAQFRQLPYDALLLDLSLDTSSLRRCPARVAPSATSWRCLSP